MHTFFEELVSNIGFEPALKLVAGWGGSTLYIPDKYDSAHLIARVLGEDAAIKLELEHGGQTLCVPRVNLSGVEREVSVLKLYSEGAHTRTIALALRITSERVKQIIQRHGMYKQGKAGI